MCVIIAGLGTAVPTEQQLMRGCVNNPDGFGWGVVYLDDDDYYAIKWNSDMIAERAVDQYLETMSGLGEAVVASAFHARITTHGGSVLENCHPFPVGGDERTLVFHNGILDIPEHNGKSDTRRLAEEVLPAMGGLPALENRFVYDMVSQWTKGSKLVFLSIDPAVDLPLTIVNEDAGYWEGDLWFSNRSCEPFSSALPRARSVVIGGRTFKFTDSDDDWDEWDDRVECPVCEQLTDTAYAMCETCYSCIDCGMAIEQCACKPLSQSLNTAWDMEAF